MVQSMTAYIKHPWRPFHVNSADFTTVRVFLLFNKPKKKGIWKKNDVKSEIESVPISAVVMEGKKRWNCKLHNVHLQSALDMNSHLQVLVSLQVHIIIIIMICNWFSSPVNKSHLWICLRWMQHQAGSCSANCAIVVYHAAS